MIGLVEVQNRLMNILDIPATQWGNIIFSIAIDYVECMTFWRVIQLARYMWLVHVLGIIMFISYAG